MSILKIKPTIVSSTKMKRQIINWLKNTPSKEVIQKENEKLFKIFDKLRG